jgi:hypothetical protein
LRQDYQVAEALRIHRHDANRAGRAARKDWNECAMLEGHLTAVLERPGAEEKPVEE